MEINLSIPNADTMRERNEKHKRDTLNKHIFTAIEAINKRFVNVRPDETYVYINEYIPEQVKEKLQEKGFNVTKVGPETKDEYKIDWIP